MIPLHLGLMDSQPFFMNSAVGQQYKVTRTFLSFELNGSLYIHRSTHSLTHSMTHSLIWSHNSLVSHLKLVPGSRFFKIILCNLGACLAGYLTAWDATTLQPGPQVWGKGSPQKSYFLKGRAIKALPPPLSCLMAVWFCIFILFKS